MPSPISVTDSFGRKRTEPTAFAKTDLQKAVAVRLSLFNDVVVIGNFPSGTPDVVQTFANPEDFAKVHDENRDDDVAVQLVRRATVPFKEPNIGGAGIVRSVQVGNPTRSTRLWQTGATTKITFTTTVYGLPSLKFESKLVAGTAANTAKLSVRKRGDPQTLIERDNLGLAFTIQYTGVAATGTMTITVVSDAATKVELLEAAVVKHTFNATDAQYKTVGQLAAAIDDLTDYTCTLATGVDPTMPITNLDATAAQDIKTTAFTAKAALGAIVYYVNQNLADYYTAARAAGQTTFGDFDLDFVYATGGTNPTVVLQDWRDALVVLDDADLDGGFILPVTTDSAVQAIMTDFSIDQLARRSKTWKVILATAAGATATQAKALAFQQSWLRTMVVFQRVQDNNADGVLTDYDPIHGAAIMAGGSAGTPVTNPLTGKRMNVKGLKDNFGLPAREDLLENGVTTFKYVRGFGFVPAQAVSTATDTKRMPRVWQDVIAADTLHNSIYALLKTLPGGWATLELQQGVEQMVTRALELAEAAGIISKGKDAAGTILPAFASVAVTIGSGLITVTWKAFIGGEVDFVDIRGDVEYQEFGVTVPL